LNPLLNIPLAGLLFLYLAITSLDQFFGALLLYLFVTFYQVSSESNAKQYLNPITLAGLTLLTFKFQIENSTRIYFLISLILLFFLFYRNKLDFQRANYKNLTMVILMMILGTKLLQSFRELLLQFLGLGYDNAFHLSSYRGYRLTSWFPDGSQIDFWTEFDLFRSSPTGSSALFSTFSNLLIGSNHEAFSEMSAFAVTNIAMLITSIAISIKFVLNSPNKVFDKRLTMIVIPGAVGVMIYSTGTMLVNGFPPYVAVTLLLLYWIRMQTYLHSTGVKLFNLSFTGFIILLVTPGPFAFLILPGIYLTIKLIFELARHRKPNDFILGLASSSVLGAISYLEFSSTSGSFGWRQILEPGGVHRPSLLIAVSVTLTFIAVSFKNRNDFLVWLTLASGLSSVALLSTLTLAFTGSVQYYAVKQFFVWLPLACLYLLRQAFCFFLKKKKAGNAAFASLLVYLLLYSLSWTSSSSIGWMGTPINAIRNLINQSVWNQSIIYAPNFLKNYSTGIYANSRCIIFRVNMSESDLNSRWANALTNPIRMSSECFSGFWNSSSLSSIDLISRLGGLDESYLLVVPLNDMKSLTELSLPKNVVVSTQ
jgi:hypothetical protein